MSVSKMKRHLSQTEKIFMHNGVIDEFERDQRNLTLAIDPDLFVYLKESTDPEVIVFLLLTHGLKADP
jgi:predicted glutamine amidotransferase